MDLSEGPPEGLFFAGSDDDNEDAIMDTPQTPPTSSRASSPLSALFIPGSDDENLAEMEDVVSPVKQKRRFSFPEDESNNGIELPVLNMKERVQSTRKMSVVPESSSAKPSASLPPPPKKRRTSPPSALPHTFQPTYVGDILVPNAWSNVSGKGYVKLGESIQIKRDEQTDSKLVRSKLATAQGNKKGDKMKQMSLTAMLKSKSSKKTKTDSIVRLFNSRGFGNVFASCPDAGINKSYKEFGRLPTDVSWWVSKLLDLGGCILLCLYMIYSCWLSGIVEFRGTMTDCPEKLTTGATLIVALHAYMLASAFTPPAVSQAEDKPVMFNEGLETVDEK